MKHQEWFLKLAQLFGWILIPKCQPIECHENGCDYPYCTKWEFRPDLTA